MADSSQTPDPVPPVPPTAPRANPNPVRSFVRKAVDKVSGDSVKSLREKYDKLAAECADAVASGNKPAVKELKEKKKAAFAAWWEASAPERKAAKKGKIV